MGVKIAIFCALSKFVSGENRVFAGSLKITGEER